MTFYRKIVLNYTKIDEVDRTVGKANISKIVENAQMKTNLHIFQTLYLGIAFSFYLCEKYEFYTSNSLLYYLISSNSDIIFTSYKKKQKRTMEKNREQYNNFCFKRNRLRYGHNILTVLLKCIGIHFEANSSFVRCQEWLT